MKILHFLWGLPNGGAENLAVDLANEQSCDNEVILFVANKRVDDSVRSRISPAVQFVGLGRPENSRNPYWVARLLFSLHAIRPDIIHSHADSLASLARFIAAPLILTVHTTDVVLAIATEFSVVCCISESVLLDVMQRYPLLNLHLVNNGVTTSKIATRVRSPSDLVRGVQVSRLVHETKGQDLLIRSLAKVNTGRNQSKLTVDFIGDGPSLDYLIAVAAEAGVSEFCNFLGAISRSDIYKNLCNYDILIQPSRIEGFGLTVAEGMAAGVAVVVSDVEGPMEIIRSGEFGHFFKTGDVDSLAATLQNVISSMHSPEESALLLAARNHVAVNYDLSRTSDHYCSIYREVIDA